jgi:glycosyltransferase involved in cell wall biosynthesis
LGFAADDFVVGYVGNVPMQRGGKEVIDVVACLGSNWNVKGLVVGDGGEAQACRQYAQQRGVSDAVVICGELDYGQLPDVVASMDVGLSILRPRERGASEQKVRQYLAAGLCVVGTAGSNNFLRGHEFARVVETAQPEEVVSAVASFLEAGREGISKLGLRARLFAEDALSIEARNDERLQLWREGWISAKEKASGG